MLQPVMTSTADTAKTNVEQVLLIKSATMLPILLGGTERSVTSG